MLAYITRRVLFLVPILFFASIIVFFIGHNMPGDPASIMLGTEAADPQKLESARERLGLDEPLYQQYFSWISGVVTGDLGISLRTGKPISQLIIRRFPFTIELAVYSLLLALIIAVPLGTFSAAFDSDLLEILVQGIMLIGMSIPAFWSGIIAILIFSVYLDFFPLVNFPYLWNAPLQNLYSLLLPAIVLAIPNAAVFLRMMRSSSLENLQEDYIRTARAKGLPESIVLFKHLFKNALIPLITLIGIRMGYLLGGSVIVEQVFSIPGLGRLGVQAIFQRDYPVFQSMVLMVTGSFVVVNLIVDILYAYIDPRIRYS
jgi:peptide/nickel transport system permease protein